MTPNTNSPAPAGPEKKASYVLVYAPALQFGKDKRLMKGEEIPAEHFEKLATGTQALFLKKGSEVSAALLNKLPQDLKGKFTLKGKA